MDATTQIKDGVLLNVEVSTKSDKFTISGYNEWRKTVEIRIKAVPQKGRANKEIINEFSRLTGKKVEISSGLKSHHKVLKIYDAEEKDILKIISSALSEKKLKNEGFKISNLQKE